MLPNEVAVPFPPAADDADCAAQFASVAVAPVGAPDVPPPPIVTTIVAPGVVEIVEVPETIPLETEADPVTKTSPAPPPTARRLRRGKRYRRGPARTGRAGWSAHP